MILAYNKLEVQAQVLEFGGETTWHGMSAVYGLYDGDQLIYVGETGNLFRRVCTHIDLANVASEGGGDWMKNMPNPLYYHVADAMARGEFSIKVLATGIDARKDRMVVEFAKCVELGQHGLYNRTIRKVKVWPSIETNAGYELALASRKACEEEKARLVADMAQKATAWQVYLDSPEGKAETAAVIADIHERACASRLRAIEYHQEAGEKSHALVMKKIANPHKYTEAQIKRSLNLHNKQYGDILPIKENP